MHKNGIIFLALAIFVFVYLFNLEPSKLNVQSYEIAEYNLRGLKAVLIGDIHAKPKDYERLKNLADTINAQNPDMIFSVGDYINGKEEKDTMPIETIAETLSLIKARNNFYTVLGEYDEPSKERIKGALARYGIKTLENSARRIFVKGKTVYVAGVGDVTSGNDDLRKALAGVGRPTILLSHSPDIFPDVPNIEQVVVTLAGHTHGGQIDLPGINVLFANSKYRNQYLYGLVKDGYPREKKMIVTGGIGTSIIPARFNRPPEIVVINFI